MASDEPKEPITTEETPGEQVTEVKTPEQKLEETIAKGTEEGTKEPDAKQPDAKSDEDKGQESKGLPDDWTPKLPEGVKLDDGAFAEIRSTLKDMGLSPDNAQKLVDYQLKTMEDARKQSVDNWEKQVKEWETAIKESPDFKDGFEQKQAVAEGAYKEFFTPEEREYLTKSGLASYLFPAMYKIGKKVAEPATVDGKGLPPKRLSGNDPHERLSGLYGGN